jgi:DNA polymerase III epsilon subunit-like protein
MSSLKKLIADRDLLLRRGVMVDVETAGPTPSRYALLSLGANIIANPDIRFYTTFKPDRFEYVEASLRVTGFTLEDLAKTGAEPKRAIADFHQWLGAYGSEDPLFVAHNACFDWMFYADYTSRYHEDSPFGHFAFDTKSAFGSMVQHSPIPHHAEKDAYIQTLDLHQFFKTF